jgi:lipopolysaccharide/colanic/teichoic acid biosynthesis glycosyltransferase
MTADMGELMLAKLATLATEVGTPVGDVAVVEELQVDARLKRALDIVVSLLLLILLAPLMILVGVAIKLESRGTVFYRCRRVGKDGVEFDMLKFRKMREGVAGLPLTIAGDARLTRVGAFLTASKLDEIPQLWNVLRGEMTLVGPRPEDPAIVALRREEFAPVLQVTPGITGLSQLAFAEESTLLDPDDRIGFYLTRLLPQKLGLDGLYAERWSFRLDLMILFWTFAAVALREPVAVDRRTAALGVRRRPPRQPAHGRVLGLEPALASSLEAAVEVVS